MIKEFDGNSKEKTFGFDMDSLFYKVIFSIVFNDFDSFEVRRDIEIPKNKKENGVVISFDDGRIVYFKIQTEKLSDDEFESILKVCYFLQDKFGGTIESYVLCQPEIEFREYDGIKRDGIILNLSTLKYYDGDATLEKLENKRKNKEKFTIQDYISHLLLPFMGYKDIDVFLPKLQHYMMETMFNNAEKPGIEVVRL